MVLDNVALQRAEPGALPWGIKLSQGSVTISDNVQPSFAFTWPATSRTLSINASRNQSLSWTTVPVVDHDQLLTLRDVYKAAAGDTWILDGPPREIGAPTGRYRTNIVWVKKEDVARLSDLTLQVLTSQKLLPSEHPLFLPGTPPSR
jgi:hypothetical protein